MSEALPHTYLSGAWRRCARCDYRYKIETEMVWQRGLLVCRANCMDKMLLGSLEPKIALVLGDGKEELAPVEKLRNPDNATDMDDFVI